MDQLQAPDISKELEAVLATVLDPAVVISSEGIVIGWNRCAEDTFGWPASEACGRSLSELIIPPVHRAAHEAGMARLAIGEEPRVLGRLIEITAIRTDGTEIPVELSITAADTDQGQVFVGFIRDISDRKAAEQAIQQKVVEANLLFELSMMASEANSFDDALQRGLATICQIADWPVGHAFTVSSANPDQLYSTEIWHEAEPGIAEALRAATASIDWQVGLGLPGTILASREPQWISDIQEESNFVRKDLGFRGAFGFPLVDDGRIIAVLEFFTHSPTEPDPNLILTVRSLGEQIGRVFERRRRQDREALLVRELQHRTKNLMAVANAIARQTFRAAASPDEALDAFLSRLQALGQAHDLVLGSTDHEVGLEDAVLNGIKGAGSTADRYVISGPNVRMPGDIATSIILAIHELCTNAMKYGALSVPEGHVEISWGRTSAGNKFRFDWREMGGPPVSPPTREGFGTVLLKRLLEAQFNGKVEILYEPEGLHVTSITPISSVNSPK